MGALARFLIGLPLVVLYGWGGALMWVWFAVPTGLAPITMWQAAGLLLCLSFVKLWFFSVSDIPTTKHENQEALQWTLLILKPIMVLVIVGMGWLLAKGVA